MNFCWFFNDVLLCMCVWFVVCDAFFYTILMLSFLRAAVIVCFGCFWNIDHGFCDEPSSIRYLLRVSMTRCL